ncbi:hypothetical protein [Oligoflexus sp.]|nr:hypothetical protein [Oligoflexus sp.]
MQWGSLLRGGIEFALRAFGSSPTPAGVWTMKASVVPQGKRMINS